MKILPSVVKDCPNRMTSGFVPISCSDQIFARKAWMERKHYVSVRCVREPSLFKLKLHALDLIC